MKTNMEKCEICGQEHSQKTHKVYLAGPMRGIEFYNLPAFSHAAKVWRAAGYSVCNPAELDQEIDGVDLMHDKPKFGLSHYMKRDLPEVCACDLIAVLPGWEKSEGAMIEISVGSSLGKPIYDANTFQKVPLTFKPTIFPPVQSSARSSITQDSKIRKVHPIARGVLDYFPDALWEVSHVSYIGNEQHNKGEPMHWAREKSNDHADCIARHLIQRGTNDTDCLSHTAKLAWRALALLQIEIETRQ